MSSLLLLLQPPPAAPPPTGGVTAVSNTVGPVNSGPPGFTHLVVGDALVSWATGDAIHGIQITTTDAGTGWTTGDATE